jgi:hypothetical protein
MSDWFNELKTSVEKGIQSGLESASKVIVDALLDRLDGIPNPFKLFELFDLPEPAEPFRLVRVFRPTIEQPITKTGITIEGDSWRIESVGSKNILLFQISRPTMSECLFICSTSVKCESFHKVSLSLTRNTLSGGTERRSYFQEGVSGWHAWEVPLHYQQEKFTGDINIGIDFEGSGVVWLKDIQVFQAAVKPSV